MCIFSAVPEVAFRWKLPWSVGKVLNPEQNWCNISKLCDNCQTTQNLTFREDTIPPGSTRRSLTLQLHGTDHQHTLPTYPPNPHPQRERWEMFAIISTSMNLLNFSDDLSVQAKEESWIMCAKPARRSHEVKPSHVAQFLPWLIYASLSIIFTLDFFWTGGAK